MVLIDLIQWKLAANRQGEAFGDDESIVKLNRGHGGTIAQMYQNISNAEELVNLWYVSYTSQMLCFVSF